MMDMRSLYWSAGFFEGEGTVRFNKGRKEGHSCTMGFQIINCDLDALERFRLGVFGMGSIRGPYKPAKNGLSRKETYVWCTDRFHDVNALIGLLFPLLSSRRQRQIIDTFLLVKASRTQMAEAFIAGRLSRRGETKVKAFPSTNTGQKSDRIGRALQKGLL